MALFSITRYMGEDDDNDDDENVSSSKADILKNIHKKAKQRAKEKKPDIDKDIVTFPSDVNVSKSPPPKMPKKKHHEGISVKVERLSSQKPNECGNGDENPPPAPLVEGRLTSCSESVKKKKKGSKVNDDQNSLEKSMTDSVQNSGVESSDLESPSKSAKKHKRKRSLESSTSDTEHHDVQTLSDSAKTTKKKRSKIDGVVDNGSLMDSPGKVASPDDIDASASALLEDISKSLSVPGRKKKKKKNKVVDYESSAHKHNKVKSPEKLNGEKDTGVDEEWDEEMDDEMDDEAYEGEEGELHEAKKKKEFEQQAHREVGGFTLIGQVKSKAKEKVERVLPGWLAQPSVVHGNILTNRIPLSAISQLDKDLIKKLQENDIVDFFPVQGHVIPAILGSVHQQNSHTMAHASFQPYDICCSAPTGSGKTLAYVLPLIQVLKARLVRRVRVVVILPVRDLAAQVHRVFETYCTGTKLKIGLAAGQSAFPKEQESLVKKSHTGWESNVDIVVATPSRIMKHISDTPGFDLSALRFLVIDEADRLMEEVKYDWLTHLESAVYKPPPSWTNHVQRLRPTELTVKSSFMMNASIPLQKLLFSATLSQNPEKLQQMRLFQPRLYTAVVEEKTDPGKTTSDNKHKSTINTAVSGEVHSGTLEPVRGEFIGKYTTPPGLTEKMMRTSVSEKPLVLLYLLHILKYRRVLCFTKSLAVTHNLYWLIKLVGGINVMEFSSSLKSKRRVEILKKFTDGKLDMLICTDALARGMDVENVHYVISYDVPPYLKTYIHRVGRTARGGREGTAITLLDTKDVSFFKRMLREGGKSGLKEEVVDNEHLEPFVDDYRKALSQMPDVLKADRKKSLKK